MSVWADKKGCVGVEKHHCDVWLYELQQAVIDLDIRLFVRSLGEAQMQKKHVAVWVRYCTAWACEM